MLPRKEVLLRLSEGEKSLGERLLFRGATFWLEPRERAVLIGANGAGKSTLFQALAGRTALDAGKLERAKGAQVVYLPQDFRPSGGTVYQMAYQITPLYRAERQLEQTPPERLGEVWNRIRELSFWKGRMAKALSDFGLEKLWEAPAEGLSGGEGVRLGLAMSFLSGAEVLLLDEPTTHLDLKMRLRLEEMLLAYAGGVGLISHDRALVARVASTVYHLEAQKLFRVPGGFAAYLSERERIKRTVEKARHEAKKERSRLLDSADTLQPQAAQSIKKARQRENLLTRAARIQAPDPLPPERRWSLEIAAEGTPKLVLEAKDLRKAYPLEGGTQRTVIEQASLRIFRGDRIALVGANGSGKTTLLKLLLSREFPDSGERELGLGVSVAYLDQHFHGLQPQQPLFEQFRSRFGESRAAALLGGVGFRPPHWNDPPQQFSGGERARAGLALLGALRAGLLVMDEPTNHIELQLLEALERALSDYPGTLLFVSHDRTLVKRVATRFWGIEEGRLVEYPSYPEAEAAMLGRPAVRLDPYGDLPAEEAPPPAEQDLEEERMGLLNRLELAELSQRGRVRLRADLLYLEDQIFQAYAQQYFEPYPYRHRIIHRGTLFFADIEGDVWQFWRPGEQVVAQQKGALFELLHKPSKTLLAAVLRICFELQDAQAVQVEQQVYGRSAYLSSLGLSQPTPPTGPKPKRRPRRKKPNPSRNPVAALKP